MQWKTNTFGEQTACEQPPVPALGIYYPRT